MKTLFDSDGVEIVEVNQAKNCYPDLEWDSAERFFWDINNHEVMAVDDLLILIELNKRNIKLDEVEYDDIQICSVCRKVMLPDDECYWDVNTHDSLCDEHSYFWEDDNMYHKKIF